MIILTLVLAVTLVAPAYAVPASVERVQQTLKDTAENNDEQSKQKTCEEQKARIETRLSRVAKQGNSQLAVISKIADKVDAFKTKKGYAVANYETLQANVATAKAAAQLAVDDAATAPVIACSSDSKAAVTAYKATVKKRTKAMKAYKEAVHNMLVAVKTAQQQATESDVQE